MFDLTQVLCPNFSLFLLDFQEILHWKNNKKSLVCLLGCLQCTDNWSYENFWGKVNLHASVYGNLILKFILYLMSRIQEILHKRSCQKLGGRSEEHTLYCYSSRTYMYTTGLFKPRLWQITLPVIVYSVSEWRVVSSIP